MDVRVFGGSHSFIQIGFDSLYQESILSFFINNLIAQIS